MSGVVNDLIVGRCGDVAAPVRWLYDPADPYAVVVDLTALTRACEVACGEPAEHDVRTWRFARSLLTDALVLNGPTGMGDVTVEREGAYMVVTLASPDGAARLRFVRQSLIRFVLRTERLVPRGAESEHLDVDAIIEQLLRGVR